VIFPLIKIVSLNLISALPVAVITAVNCIKVNNGIPSPVVSAWRLYFIFLSMVDRKRGIVKRGLLLHGTIDFLS